MRDDDRRILDDRRRRAAPSAEAAFLSKDAPRPWASIASSVSCASWNSSSLIGSRSRPRGRCRTRAGASRASEPPRTSPTRPPFVAARVVAAEAAETHRGERGGGGRPNARTRAAEEGRAGPRRREARDAGAREGGRRGRARAVREISLRSTRRGARTPRPDDPRARGRAARARVRGRGARDDERGWGPEVCSCEGPAPPRVRETDERDAARAPTRDRGTPNGAQGNRSTHAAPQHNAAHRGD